MEVNIYIHQTIKGPRKGQQGYGIYILEALNPRRVPITKVMRMQLEGSENEASLKVLKQALSHMNMRTQLGIYIDSDWLYTGITQWLPKWKETGFITAKKEKVAFAETWEQIDQMLSNQDFTVHIKEQHSYKNWMENNAKPA